MCTFTKAPKPSLATCSTGEGVPLKSPDKPLRCLARTRSGGRCQSLPVKGKKRCRMHGGAPGSGAPSGERNGMYRHGRYTLDAMELRRKVRLLVSRTREAVGGI
jgi:hypothetical protein